METSLFAGIATHKDTLAVAVIDPDRRQLPTARYPTPNPDSVTWHDSSTPTR